MERFIRYRMSICRKPHPSDARDGEWLPAAAHLLLQRKDAGQRGHDLRAVEAGGRPQGWTTAAIIDSRTLRSTPQSGERAGYDGGKRKKVKHPHAVDTPGHLLGLHGTPASAEDRGEVERLARTVQAVIGDHIEIACVDQGYTGERAARAAGGHGIALEVVRRPEAKRGFVLVPRVVERSFAWARR